MVCVEGVAQAERVGKCAETRERGRVARVPEVQPPAGRVHQDDTAREGEQTQPRAHPLRRSGAGAPRSARRTAFQESVKAARTVFDVRPSSRTQTPQPFGSSLT